MDNNMKNEKLISAEKSRSLKLGGYSLILIAIVIAAAILVNLIVEALPTKYTKIDLTGSDIYRISEDTENFIDTLDTDITIYFISTREGRNAQLDTFVTSYAEQSSHIKVKYIDPEEDPAFTSEHGVTAENSLVIKSELRSMTVHYSDIYQYSEAIQNEYYGYYYYYGYAIEDVYSPDVFAADNEITAAIDYVTTDNLPAVYTLTGHGEADMYSMITELIEYNNIRLESLNLLSSGIPDDASIIIINNPASDISEGEAETLCSFIDNGGNVIMITDTESYSPSLMKNLSDVAKHVGLKAHEGIVLEEDTGYYTRNQYTILPRLQESPLTESIANPTNYYIAMNRAHAIVEDEEYEGSNLIVPVLLSSETAYIIGEDEEVRSRRDGDITGPFYLGAVSRNYNGDGMLIWYSSSYINTEISMSYVNYNNIIVFANSVMTVCDKAETISVGNVAINSEGTLTLTETDVMVWTVILQYLIPLAVLIPGVIIWLLRRRR